MALLVSLIVPSSYCVPVKAQNVQLSHVTEGKWSHGYASFESSACSSASAYDQRPLVCSMSYYSLVAVGIW
jgi:hypothetical protein